MLPAAAICPIAMMTFTSPDLGPVIDRYERYLDYEVRAVGTVSPELADSWAAPRSAGRRFVLLGPESGAAIYLRVVEAPPTPGFEPLQSYGWTTAEIVVKDAFTLSASLEGSPFVEETAVRVLQLDFTDDLINFRVVGPDGDALYLTQLDDEVPNFPFARATSWVDHVFMTLITNRDPRQAQRFYERLFHLTGMAPIGPDTGGMYTINLPDGCILELDSAAEGTGERPVLPGELPPGMAMATYYTDSLQRDDLEWLGEPRRQTGAPYGKRRAATLRGPSGELIELIEFKLNSGAGD